MRGLTTLAFTCVVCVVALAGAAPQTAQNRVAAASRLWRCAGRTDSPSHRERTAPPGELSPEWFIFGQPRTGSRHAKEGRRTDARQPSSLASGVEPGAPTRS